MAEHLELELQFKILEPCRGMLTTGLTVAGLKSSLDLGSDCGSVRYGSIQAKLELELDSGLDLVLGS